MLYFFYPQLRKLSGAERLILRLAAHTAKLGLPVTLLTHYFDPTCQPDLDPAVRLLVTGRRARLFHNHYLDSPLEYLASIRLLELVGADARALTFFGPPSLPALYWSKRNRKHLPHFYFCYEPPRFIYEDSREIGERVGPLSLFARPFFSLYKRLDRAMAQRADRVLANSEFAVSRLQAAYGREATVITHGVDLPAPTPQAVEAVQARYGLQGKCVVLSVNFLHPRKRLDLFLRTFGKIREQIPGAVALVVGSGPEAPRLKRAAQELQLADSVVFTGFVPDPDLPAHYAAASLYLHTAKNESFGLSVLEASAAGLPVVSVDEGGPREILVDNISGRLVPATAGALAEAVVELLRQPRRRAEMGAAGQLRVAGRFTWQRGAETFANLVRGAGQGRA